MMNRETLIKVNDDDILPLIKVHQRLRILIFLIRNLSCINEILKFDKVHFLSEN
ncbi:hypothetical protein ACUXJ3_001542 [Staphylococcus capitis]